MSSKLNRFKIARVKTNNKNGIGIAIDTSIGLAKAISDSGWGNVKRRKNIATAVFWMPVSIQIAMIFFLSRRITNEIMAPPIKPNHGRKQQTNISFQLII